MKWNLKNQRKKKERKRGAADVIWNGWKKMAAWSADGPVDSSITGGVNGWWRWAGERVRIAFLWFYYYIYTFLIFLFCSFGFPSLESLLSAGRWMRSVRPADTALPLSNSEWKLLQGASSHYSFFFFLVWGIFRLIEVFFGFDSSFRKSNFQWYCSFEYFYSFVFDFFKSNFY